MNHRKAPGLSAGAIVKAMENLPQYKIFLLCLLIIIIIGVADYLVGTELSLAIFFVIPVTIYAWHGSSLKAGFVMSLVAALVWLLIDRLSGKIYSHPSLFYWNGTFLLSFFLLVDFLLAGYRARFELEEDLAATDSLTGVMNLRAFYEKVDREIQRSKRFQRPFSLAYIDLDNFKQVNDTRGHQFGDHILRKIVEVVTLNTRVTDVMARLGGDEFAILMVEADWQGAREVAEKLRQVLLAAMEQEQCPVTFSFGLVTCERAPANVQQVVNFADGLMYSVKRSGKNRIAHARLGESENAGQEASTEGGKSP